MQSLTLTNVWDAGPASSDARCMRFPSRTACRWWIENGVFRRLSGLVDSKRRLTGNSHVREALMGLWLLGLNILSAVLGWTGLSKRHPQYDTAKVTWKWIARLFNRWTCLAYAVST